VLTITVERGEVTSLGDHRDARRAAAKSRPTDGAQRSRGSARRVDASVGSRRRSAVAPGGGDESSARRSSWVARCAEAFSGC
jgi:hypothetical protein